MRAIVGHCRTDRSLNWLGDVVVALAQTGLRINELASLRRPDADMDRWDITLADTTRRSRKSERPDTRTTKSRRDRSLAVHVDLKTVLRSLTRYPDHLVFHGPKGGKIKPDKVRRALINRALPALASRFPAVGGRPGITTGRVHRFRHYYCFCSADTGVPEQMLMSWPGRRESEMIRHYYHQRSEESQRQMGRLPLVWRRGLAPGRGRVVADRFKGNMTARSPTEPTAIESSAAKRDESWGIEWFGPRHVSRGRLIQMLDGRRQNRLKGKQFSETM
ncbi:tyrosine-type recombinase/integrase [Zavarzinella formosa]|uniref:tyrosine-type recombinase/integrase n=1 Tax=Zavarzinella formosa TaxID=360055 RepID=UPI0012F7883D|nr:tyrosine-type recombinase/integrase [Zavarzinella formosa]